MSQDQLEYLLRRWGRVFGTAPPKEWDEDSSREYGGPTSAILKRMHVGAGLVAKPSRRYHIDPTTGAVTPLFIPGMRSLTARGKESDGGERPWNPDPDCERVECAAIDLYRYDRLRGVVLRVEYCLRDRRQKEKAVYTGTCEGINDRITLRRYRHELEKGREFMAGRLFGRIAA